MGDNTSAQEHQSYTFSLHNPTIEPPGARRQVPTKLYATLPAMSNNDAAYIPVETAGEILRMTARQVNRYGNEGRLQTRRAGRRVLYLRSDVESLAAELGVSLRPAPRPRAELVPVGQMLDYLRERDARLDELQRQLLSAATEIGRLQQTIEHQRLLADQAEQLRARVADLEAERDQLRAELDALKRQT